MYRTLALVVFLLAIAMMMIHWRPERREGFRTSKDGTLALSSKRREGFAVAAVDPARMPACVERSTAAQSLLARFADLAGDDAAELRLLVSKLCCIEADLVTPAAGVYRTFPLQFRTSHDMEAPSTFVGRCLAGSVPKRDVELATAKFEKRGRELVRSVLGDCAESLKEFDEVLARTRGAMMTTCMRPSPTMDHPLGARDLGFWETNTVADLSQYQGVSAIPK